MNKVEIEHNGMSGAKIELFDSKIYKTHNSSKESYEWYKIAENFVNVPKVYELKDNTIVLEYLEKHSEPKVNDLLNIIELFSKIHIKSHLFKSYIERIEGHLNIYNPEYKNLVIKSLFEIDGFMNKSISFMHGDFTLDNVINTKRGLYLIDPNSIGYSSYILDISKLLMSTKRKNKMVLYNYLLNEFSKIIPTNILLKLELTHWIRMRKYNTIEDKIITDENIQLLIMTVL